MKKIRSTSGRKGHPLRQQVIELFLEQDTGTSSGIHQALTRASQNGSALVTVKRLLSALAKEHILTVVGKGAATRYELTMRGRLLADLDAHAYFFRDPDQRFGETSYRRDMWNQAPARLFSATESARLQEATMAFRRRVSGLSSTLRRKELERFIIELSWKSSKIEGNTYSLLDTARLIEKGVEAPHHSKEEAVMILNHKHAFQYVHDHPDAFITLTRKNMEEIHSLIVERLGVTRGLRKKPVGVTGSRYQPLDNAHQIAEAVENLATAVQRTTGPFAKALLAIAGISYIQPFEDGNKRTARLMGNAILLAHGCAPLSYRSVEEDAYREAMLAFYELGTLAPFKRIFIEQYLFAASTYLVSP